jgi:hypothetical protein
MSKSNKYGKLINANKAGDENVKSIIQNFPDLDFPIKIRESNKDSYQLACITKGRPDSNGLVKNRAIFPVININSWEAMPSHNNKAFNCHIVVILHDPTIQNKPKGAKQLSPSQKKDVNELVSAVEGEIKESDIESIADQLGIEITRVKNYLK